MTDKSISYAVKRQCIFILNNIVLVSTFILNKLYASEYGILEDYGGALNGYSWQDLSSSLAEKVADTAEKLVQPFA